MCRRENSRIRGFDKASLRRRFDRVTTKAKSRVYVHTHYLSEGYKELAREQCSSQILLSAFRSTWKSSPEHRCISLLSSIFKASHQEQHNSVLKKIRFMENPFSAKGLQNEARRISCSITTNTNKLSMRTMQTNIRSRPDPNSCHGDSIDTIYIRVRSEIEDEVMSREMDTLGAWFWVIRSMSHTAPPFADWGTQLVKEASQAYLHIFSGSVFVK